MSACSFTWRSCADQCSPTAAGTNGGRQHTNVCPCVSAMVSAAGSTWPARTWAAAPAGSTCAAVWRLAAAPSVAAVCRAPAAAGVSLWHASCIPAAAHPAAAIAACHVTTAAATLSAAPAGAATAANPAAHGAAASACLFGWVCMGWLVSWAPWFAQHSRRPLCARDRRRCCSWAANLGSSSSSSGSRPSC